jgi:phosphatidate cytidylyltransferase
MAKRPLAARTFTVLVGGPLILWAVWTGGWPLLGALALVSAVGFAEILYLYGHGTMPGFERPLGYGLGFTAALLYIPFLLGHLYLLRAGPEGLRRALLTVAAVWATDLVAFFAGRYLGRHKLAPRLSPGKTVEGAVAGLLAGMAVGVIGHLGAAFGLAVAVAAEAGDLFESWLKRRARVKDSGTILPGHGGVLDRFDSLFLAAPVAYWFLRLHL